MSVTLNIAHQSSEFFAGLLGSGRAAANLLKTNNNDKNDKTRLIHRIASFFKGLIPPPMRGIRAILSFLSLSNPINRLSRHPAIRCRIACAAHWRVSFHWASAVRGGLSSRCASASGGGGMASNGPNARSLSRVGRAGRGVLFSLPKKSRKNWRCD